MKTFLSLVRKETLHIVRDPRTMFITLLMPIMLLLLFGYAISTEVNDIRIAAIVDNHNDETRQILERFEANEYFTFQGLVSPSELDSRLRRGETDAVLVLKTDGGKLTHQIIVDASNTNTAQAVTGYIQGLLANPAKSAPIVTRTLYNPQMKSAYNFVPGLLGMIFILICAIITSVSIVREKETGTLNLLLVSPAKPSVIILGKLVTYFLLSCIILVMMLLISYTLLELPVSASIVNVISVTLLYIVLSLSIGLLVSTLVDTQLNALIVSGVLFMLPVIMLSGMLFPIENMPWPLQWLSCIIPARWYVEAMRGLMIQQLPLSCLTGEIVILAVMTAVLLGLAIKNFKKETR